LKNNNNNQHGFMGGGGGGEREKEADGNGGEDLGETWTYFQSCSLRGKYRQKKKHAISKSYKGSKLGIK